MIWYPLLYKERNEVIVMYHLNTILLFILWDFRSHIHFILIIYTITSASSPSQPPASTASSQLNAPLLQPTELSVTCLLLCVHEHRAIYWSLDNLLLGTPLKKTVSPSLGSHQLLIPLLLRMGPDGCLSLIHAEILTVSSSGLVILKQNKCLISTCIQKWVYTSNLFRLFDLVN